MPTWEDVEAIGLRYPGVEAASWFGTPGLRVAGKGMCRVRTNPDALVIRVLDLGDREALLKGQPDVFFTTPHYDGYLRARPPGRGRPDPARGARRGRLAHPRSQVPGAGA